MKSSKVSSLKLGIVFVLVFGCAVILFSWALRSLSPDVSSGRWSEERAAAWYAKQEWPVGCNYVPAYAVNAIEHWQAETFRADLIDRELALAESVGFNTLRIFLNDKVWEADRAGFKARLEQFMDMADKRGMKLIITFFTNGGTHEGAKLGKQPDPLPDVHNGRWVQSPGAPKVNDPTKWPVLKEYVQDILRTWKDDPRVLLWCLYNEPENVRKDENYAESLPLLRAVFAWAREVNPSQPLSSPIWQRPGINKTASKLDIISFLGENCDVMTFHCYHKPKETEAFVAMMKRFNRPLVCMEYMGRPDNTFENCLPIFKRERIGAISWGLVQGKTNTHLLWASKRKKNYDPTNPSVWFHDIFRADGSPYSQEEVDFLRSMTGKKP